MDYRDTVMAWSSIASVPAGSEADAARIMCVADLNALGTTQCWLVPCDMTITQLVSSVVNLQTPSGSATQAGTWSNAGMILELHSATPDAAGANWAYTAAAQSHKAIAKWPAGTNPLVRIDVVRGTWLAVVLRDKTPDDNSQIGAQPLHIVTAGVVLAPVS